MRLATNIFKAAIAVSCLAVAACGGSSAGKAVDASLFKTAVPGSASSAAASLSGTTIPSGTEIIDSGRNVWTVVDGVIYENGELAGYSRAVALLLYDNGTIYQENSTGGWWSWNGNTWASSSDPRKVASANATTIPAVSQITDADGNVWVVASGVVYENGGLAGYTTAVTQLLYDNGAIYQENASGGWWSWNGKAWVASSDPQDVASANGTTLPSATQIVDSSGNVWTLVGGVVYENGAAAGYSNAVTRVVYDNNAVYQENSSGGWWSWKANTWVASTDPVTVSTPLAISGIPATSDTVGVAYKFVPTTTSPGGTLSFSVTNLPAWATFSTATGALTGTPSSAQVGSYPNIVISVNDGSGSASLAAFTIKVAASTVSATGAADLSWTAPTENTNGTPLTDLAGYTIYYGTSASEMTQTVQLASPSATSYVVANLSAGTYYFAVAAYSTDGTRSAESPIGSKTIL